MLKRLLDSMSYAKMNVLHWHAVDDQSFPLTLDSYPNLQGHGAFSPRERYANEPSPLPITTHPTGIYLTSSPWQLVRSFLRHLMYATNHRVRVCALLF